MTLTEARAITIKDGITKYRLARLIIGKARRKNTVRKEKNQALKDLGLTKVKGALGGVYWE